MSKILALISSLFLLSVAALAQRQMPDTKQPPSKVERLNRAPVSNDILKVKLPRPQEVNLPNGLTVLVLEQHRLPTVYYGLWIKTGALADPKDIPGLASFTAGQLREGTGKRSSTQIAAELDDL